MEEEAFTIITVPRSVNHRRWGIISGGQTGVDRAGLVAAMSYSIPVGGWLPMGRLAEDGVVPKGFYNMRECDGGYIRRTKENVRSADATLILSDRFPLSQGTALTEVFARHIGKPCKVFDLNAADAEERIREWMLSLENVVPAERKRIVLNVAGPRESVSPGIFEKAKNTLCAVFIRFRNGSGGDLCDIDDDGNLCGWIDAECVGYEPGTDSGEGGENTDAGREAVADVQVKIGALTATIKDGSAVITECDEDVRGAVVIPDMIDGLPVTGIGAAAFAECSNLESVTIPDSVAEIGVWAFAGCFRLTSVMLPRATRINQSSFPSKVVITRRKNPKARS